MTHPTDALRLVPVDLLETVEGLLWLEGYVVEAQRLNDLAAVPASPLPGGGMRPDRIAELPDFLIALFDEWGEEDHAEAAKQIVTFLTDSEGLERYRESYGLPAAPTGAK